MTVSFISVDSHILSCFMSMKYVATSTHVVIVFQSYKNICI